MDAMKVMHNRQNIIAFDTCRRQLQLFLATKSQPGYTFVTVFPVETKYVAGQVEFKILVYLFCDS